MAGVINDILYSTYSAIRGREQSRTLAPLTLDHLLQEQIESIKGGDSRKLLSISGARLTANSRVSKLEALIAIEQGVASVVQALNKAGSDEEKLFALGLGDIGQEEP